MTMQLRNAASIFRRTIEQFKAEDIYLSFTLLDNLISEQSALVLGLRYAVCSQTFYKPLRPLEKNGLHWIVYVVIGVKISE